MQLPKIGGFILGKRKLTFLRVWENTPAVYASLSDLMSDYINAFIIISFDYLNLVHVNSVLLTVTFWEYVA